jgi:rifampicin phosphotransferase
MTTPFILPFATEPALAVLGGKGKSLASLTNAGFAVPQGFHITTAAYQHFIDSNDLHDAIIGAAKPEERQGSLSFETGAAKVKALFAAAAFPEDLAHGIAAAFGDFASTPVAVRSSATAEDLPDLSFAGQQDTYLNILGVEALLPAVRNCWASLWTARAISYRHQMGIAHDDVAMAVVVQEMVNAEVSGVLFTANPATGCRDELIINASFGLGEAIVSGEVTPDAYVISCHPRQGHWCQGADGGL